MLKLSLEKGSILSAIQKTQLKNYGCSWSTMFKAWTYEEKDAANIKEYLQGKGIKFEAVKIPDIDKGKSVKEKALETRIDILTEQTYTARTALALELKAFDEDMILADLDNIPLKDAYETAIQFAKVKDLHERWITIKAQEKELENLITSQESQEKEGYIFNGLTFDEMENIPPKQWIIDKVFGRKDLGMIFGESGCGKTFVVVDMIISLCHQEDWADSMSVNEEVKIAYFAGEGFAGLAERFKAAARSRGFEKIPNFTLFDKMPQLFLGSDVNEYQESMKRFVIECKKRDYKPDILIIDTLHTAIVDAEENSAKDVGRILSSCKHAISELGCSVILVHHTNKGGNSERGSGALRGGMDFMLEVRMPENKNTGYHRVCCSKLKDGEVWKEKLFSLSKVNGFQSVCVKWNCLTIDEEKDYSEMSDKKMDILNLLKLNANIGFTYEQIIEETGIPLENIKRLTLQLFNDGKCFKEFKYPDQKASFKNPIVHIYRN